MLSGRDKKRCSHVVADMEIKLHLETPLVTHSQRQLFHLGTIINQVLQKDKSDNKNKNNCKDPPNCFITLHNDLHIVFAPIAWKKRIAQLSITLKNEFKNNNNNTQLAALHCWNNCVSQQKPPSKNDIIYIWLHGVDYFSNTTTHIVKAVRMVKENFPNPILSKHDCKCNKALLLTRNYIARKW